MNADVDHLLGEIEVKNRKLIEVKLPAPRRVEPVSLALTAPEGWYHGQIPRDRADALLMEAALNGTYLVRASASSPGDFVLNVYYEDAVENYLICKNASGTYFTDDKEFSNVAELVHYYRNNPLECGTALIEPICCPSQMISFMCVCIAKSIYRFQSDDPEDLPFEVDELLYILDDSDPDWWSARTRDGREGNVPSNYCRVTSGIARQTSAQKVQGQTQGNSLSISSSTSSVGKQASAGDQSGHLVTPELVNQAWFHGHKSRKQAERSLSIANIEGAYLVRYHPAENEDDEFCLSVRVGESARHYKIYCTRGEFHIGKVLHPTVECLLEYYCKAGLVSFTNGAPEAEYISLAHPVRSATHNLASRTSMASY